MSSTSIRIGVVGGTGSLGAAIARRLAKIGHSVTIGSRSAESARSKAAELGHGVQGAGNVEAVSASDVVFVCVPYAAHSTTFTEIAPYVSGKIVVDTTVPLVPPKVMRVQLPAEGSAAVRAQKLLGPSVQLVSAMHHVAAHKLATDQKINSDVLVFGDDKEARAKVMQLISAMGMRALHGGSLANSAAAEALTSVLILINKTYGVDGAGLVITGVES